MSVIDLRRKVLPRSLVKHGADAIAAARAAADRIGVPIEWLAFVLHLESSWNPKARNAQSGAIGLAQWLPSTARNLGVDPSAIPGMTIPEQLALLVRYARKVARGKSLDRPVDMWLLLFAPKHIGAEHPKVLFARGTTAYAQNSGLDFDRDGKITVDDMARTLDVRTEKVRTVEVEVPDYDPLAPMLAGAGTTAERGLGAGAAALAVIGAIWFLAQTRK